MRFLRPIVLWLLVCGTGVALAQPAKARRAPATLPAGAVAVDGLSVTADGRECAVRTARVAPEDARRRWLAMDDAAHPTDHFDTAAFVHVPTPGNGPVRVVVRYRGPVTAARLLPATPAVPLALQPNGVSFDIQPGQRLTLELNGDATRSLHLFAGPPTVGHTPGAIVYGPGVHYLDKTVVVGDGQTVEIDDAAILMAAPGSGPVFQLTGKGIVFRGRGILDGSLTPRHSRHLIAVQDAQDVTIDGPTLRDCSTFTLPVRRSDRVTIRDVKILGYRANSDGIDVCNSRHVLVENCFVRTLDDLIVIKTDAGQGPATDITVRGCVLWNAVAHALSIGAEVREPVERVTFANCDVIHDVGREWTLRVFNADSGAVRDVRFEDIRVAESAKLMSLWVGQAVWSRDATRGTIDGVTFKDVRCASGPAAVELVGADAAHGVRDVTFDRVTTAGGPLTEARVVRNAFVHGVRVDPAR